MKKIAIVWTIVLITILSGLTFFGFRIKKETINELMEDEIVKQTEKYLGLYTNLYPKLNNSTKIEVSKLIEEGYDPKLETDCDGYIIIKNTEMGFRYYPYITCPEYTTDGYAENSGE